MMDSFILCLMKTTRLNGGGSFGREFELSAVDDERRLALYGEMPLSADVVRFACGQFVCLFKGEVVGFIIACPRFAFEVKDE